jgi:transcriptional accessory protein Tex/SPT6
MIGSITSDELRALKGSYEQTKIIKHRVATIIKTVVKMGKWTPEFHTLITSIKSLAELEQIYSLYKPTSKRLLADKAIDLGLEPISNAILYGGEIPLLTSLIDEQKEGLRNENEVIENIIYLTAHFISKDNKIFDKISSLRATSCIAIQTNLCKIQDTSDTEDTMNLTTKYKQYFNVKINLEDMKPRQIFIIRRAELQKIITMKIIISDEFKERFEKYCLSLYRWKMRKMINIQQYLLNESICYAYKKIINPLIKHRVRKDLKKRGQTIAMEIFAVKVKQLLLVPPLRGQVVLGINPSFHECNLAVVSEHGKLLKSEVIHPHKHFKYAVNILEKLITRYKCTVLALGNGTAYKETEELLKKIKSFGSLKIKYAIVNQSIASIYSYSHEAKSEFPDLNLNLISAVSIARRLQDPLMELLKIKMKHLGIGIYQYDFPEEKLSDTLNEVSKI